MPDLRRDLELPPAAEEAIFFVLHSDLPSESVTHQGVSARPQTFVRDDNSAHPGGERLALIL